MNLLQILVGFNLVSGTLGAITVNSPASPGNHLQRPNVIGDQSPFGKDKPLPGSWGGSHVLSITAFRNETGPAELPIPGAKHMSIWYNGPQFPKKLELVMLILLCYKRPANSSTRISLTCRMIHCTSLLRSAQSILPTESSHNGSVGHSTFRGTLLYIVQN